MGKRVPTPAERRGALHHLTYEVRMLLETAGRLHAGEACDVVARNAYVESFSIHARNVIESTVLGSRDDKVVTLEDFGARLPLLEPSHDQRIRRAYGEASARVAHVTWRREEPNPSVDLGIVGPLVERFLLIVDQLPPDVPIDGVTMENLKMIRRWSAPPTEMGSAGPTGPVGPTSPTTPPRELGPTGPTGPIGP